MNPHEHITHSAEETMALGRKLAPTLKDARMVILRGDLGTGKTTLVKGIAEGLQAASQDDVTSPTFTLIHEYRGPEVNLYHVDLYRIDTPRELDTLGLDELFAEEGNLVLLEWGEKFPRFEKGARRGDFDRTPRRSGATDCGEAEIEAQQKADAMSAFRLRNCRLRCDFENYAVAVRAAIVCRAVEIAAGINRQIAGRI